MKIYKFASINAAIAILKNGGVFLSNPKDFNDPNDCSFVQDENDKKKTEKLITDYFVFKVFEELVSQNKVNLNKTNRALLKALQKEMDAEKDLLQKDPYFTGIPGFNSIYKIVGSRFKEIMPLVTNAKQQLQAIVDKAVNEAKESALISCFSKRNNSILMWSHYANSHKGACIEYEKPDSDAFRDVLYRNDRPTIKLYKAVSHALALVILQKNTTDFELGSSLKEILDPFFVKSKDWSYEEEVRCLYSKTKLPKNAKYLGKRTILDLGYPTAIYVGCKATGDELDHLYNLAENRGIPIYFMEKSSKTFDIVVNEHYVFQPGNRKNRHKATLLRLIDDIDRCLNSKIYLAAFASSLIIPAICSQVECPEILDSKQRYIKWCDAYLPCANRESDERGMADLTGEVLWNLKEKLFSEGNIDVGGNYGDFSLKKMVLRIEERNDYDMYCDVLGEDDITASITKFCVDAIHQANRCYKQHEEQIKALIQLPIEDFDEQLEVMREFAIRNERIKKGG